MSSLAITKRQLDRGAVRACWNAVYPGPMRADLLESFSEEAPEAPCGNPECHRHGQVRKEHFALGDPDTRAYRGHQLRERLKRLAQKRASAKGSAEPLGGGPSPTPARFTDGLADDDEDAYLTDASITETCEHGAPSALCVRGHCGGGEP